MGTTVAHGSSAEPNTIAIDWQAPDGCPAGEVIERDVVRRLAAVPDWRERVSDLKVRAEVVGEGAHWQLNLEIEQAGQVGQRVVAGQTCQEIADAASLLVAMTVDPSADLGPSAAADEQPEPGLSEPEREATVPEPASSRAPDRRPEDAEPDSETVTPMSEAPEDEVRPQVELAIGPAFGTAGLPATGFGLTGGAALVATRFRVEVEGSYWFPRTRPVPTLPDASVRFRLATIGVRGCARLVHSKLEVPLCGGVYAGGVRGDGSGLSSDGTHTGILAAIVVSPGLMLVPAPWFVLRLRSDVGFNLARPRFLIRNYGEFFRPPVVTVGLVLSLGFRF